MLHMNIHISYKYMDNSYEFHLFIYVYNFYQIFYLEVLLFYGGGCDGFGECSVKGAFGMTRGRCVCVCGGGGGGRGRWGKVCIGSAMQKGVGEDGKGNGMAL